MAASWPGSPSPSRLGVGHGSGCSQQQLPGAQAPLSGDPRTTPRLKAHWGPFQVLGDTEPLPRPWKRKVSPPPVKAWANLALSEAGRVQPRLPAPTRAGSGAPTGAGSGAPTSGVILLNSDHWGFVEQAVKAPGVLPLETEMSD